MEYLSGLTITSTTNTNIGALLFDMQHHTGLFNFFDIDEYEYKEIINKDKVFVELTFNYNSLRFDRMVTFLTNIKKHYAAYKYEQAHLFRTASEFADLIQMQTMRQVALQNESLQQIN